MLVLTIPTLYVLPASTFSTFLTFTELALISKSFVNGVSAPYSTFNFNVAFLSCSVGLIVNLPFANVKIFESAPSANDQVAVTPGNLVASKDGKVTSVSFVTFDGISTLDTKAFWINVTF